MRPMEDAQQLPSFTTIKFVPQQLTHEWKSSRALQHSVEVARQ